MSANGILGSLASPGLGIASNPAQLQNSRSITQAQYQQQLQQMQAFNAALQQQTPQWVFNGQTMTFEQFCDAVWPEDSPEKTMFVLKYTK